MNRPGLNLAILLWSADLHAPHRLATPFLMAQTALAMDARVEMFFTAQSVALLQTRHAGLPVGFGAQAQTLQVHIEATVQAGASLWACSQAMRGLDLAMTDLQPCVAGPGGLVQFMSRVQDPQWRTLVF